MNKTKSKKGKNVAWIADTKSVLMQLIDQKIKAKEAVLELLNTKIEELTEMTSQLSFPPSLTPETSLTKPSSRIERPFVETKISFEQS